MKINIILFLLIFCWISVQADILVELTDPAGDDYGTGSTKYPENPMFVEGIFDLLKFTFTEENDQYIFSFEFKTRIDPVSHHEFQYSYDLPDDFILPLIHVYLDTDHVLGSGFTETINGTNVEITPESAWEKAIVISSLPDKYEAALQKQQPEIAYHTVIPREFSISRDRKVISVQIDKAITGEFNDNWGFIILIMGHEFSQTLLKNIYIREVKPVASQFNFGGGEGSLLKNYDPNIIDLVTSAEYDQKDILGEFDNDAKSYAVIPAVYPTQKGAGRIIQKGIVKQVSQEKVVVNLGSNNDIQSGMILIIDDQYEVIAQDVFPDLTIAEFIDKDNWQLIEEEMKVKIKEKQSIDPCGEDNGTGNSQESK